MTAWKQTFAAAFVGQIFSLMGFSLGFPFLPFFLKDLGILEGAQQAWWAGTLQGVSGITLAIFAPIWGILADRYGRKRMVVRAMCGGVVVLALISIARNVGDLVICRILQGALTGTVSASVALVASVVPEKRSGFALGMMQAAVMIGVCLGPLLGGFIAAWLGYRWAFRIGALVMFLGMAIVLFGCEENFRPTTRQEEREQGRLVHILACSGFIAAVLVLFSVRFSNSIAGPVYPLLVKEILGPLKVHLKDQITGTILSVASISGALAAGLLGHFGDRWGHRRVLMGSAVSAAIASLLISHVETIPMLYCTRILFGFAVAGMMPAANAFIRQASSGENIGKAFGFAGSVSMLGMAFGPFLGGWLAKTYTLRLPFAATAVCQILVATIAFLLVRPPAREN